MIVRRSALLGLLALLACGDGPTGPDALQIVIEGDGQLGLGGWALENTVVVRVVDGSGNAMPGSVLSIRAGQGGRASPGRATTDERGEVSVTWTLGPDPGSQELDVSVSGSSITATASATALAPDQADLVVVRGALAPLIGVAVVEPGATMRVVVGNAVADTIFAIPPLSGGESLVIFGRGNRPLLTAPTWTSGVDTVEVTMLPPVVIDLDVDVRVGSFAQQQQVMAQQIAQTEWIFENEGMGVVFGTVSYTDNTQPGVEDPRVSSGLCSGKAPGGPAIEVTMISTIDDGDFVGWGCWSGHIFLAINTGQVPNLLAHELGHTFTLIHSPDGMMRARGPQTDLREGESFRAHFHQSSTLNRSYASQSVSQRLNCSDASRCLPQLFDLGSLGPSTVAQPYPGPAAGSGTRPVDAVGEKDLHRH